MSSEEEAKAEQIDNKPQEELTPQEQEFQAWRQERAGKQAAEEQAKKDEERRAFEKSQSEKYVNLYNHNRDMHNPHGDRAEVEAGTTLTEGLHRITLEDGNGGRKLALLLEDGESSSLIGA